MSGVWNGGIVEPDTLMLAAAERIAPFVAHPPPQHWLDSDASYSYCWPCARKARWKEMGHEGEAPEEPETRFVCSEVEEEIRSGIDGGDWYNGESDTPQSCNECGSLLRFSLTNYGVEYTYEGLGSRYITETRLADADTVFEIHEMLSQGAWLKDRKWRRRLRSVAAKVLRLTAVRSAPRSDKGGAA